LTKPLQSKRAASRTQSGTQSATKIGARFLFAVDDYLRKRQRRRGDMSNLIAEAIESVDLATVELARFHGKKPPMTAKATQLVIPLDLRQELERWADQRRCTMNELLNSALIAIMPRESRTAGSQGSAGSFDKLTSQEREQFFADLLSQTGLDPGPDLCSREGSYYEYDASLGEVVEATRAGKRFVVDAIDGGELVRVHETGHPRK
jgi:hypothetical protein